MNRSKNGDTLFEYIEGESQILISAPHLHPHRRPNLSGVLKQGEAFTEYIVEALCQETGSHGIIATDSSDYDPNHQVFDKNPFKKQISKIIKEHQIKYLIDIHGLNDKHKYDLGIYHQKGFRNSRLLAYHLATGLNKEKLRGVLIQLLYFREEDGESISTYCTKELKIASVQIEIAKYIREDDKLRENLIKNLSSQIKKLS